MRIHVLNPNSSIAVTASIAACLAPQVAMTAHDVTFSEIAEAPKGIETDEDVALAARLVEKGSETLGADALIVACFSDPGVGAARAHVPHVFGIAEAAYCTAILHGAQFGVISLGAASIARHAAHIERLGLTARLAADRAVDLSVAEANDPKIATERIAKAGAALLQDGADVLILGCAGMGAQRLPLQAALGCVVIDPVQAALSAAISALDLGYGERLEA